MSGRVRRTSREESGAQTTVSRSKRVRLIFADRRSCSTRAWGNGPSTRCCGRFSVDDPTGRGVGWRGRIRTFDLLIQSQAPYRLATRQWRRRMIPQSHRRGRTWRLWRRVRWHRYLRATAGGRSLTQDGRHRSPSPSPSAAGLFGRAQPGGSRLRVSVGPADAAAPPRCKVADKTTSSTADRLGALGLDTTSGCPRHIGRPASSRLAAGLSGGGSIRRAALADLRAMVRASRAAHARLAVESAYRSTPRRSGRFRRSSMRAGIRRRP